jgi:hypothetical protein
MQERIKKPNLQRGLGGDGVLRGGEEREPHGLIALKVDLGGLEARKPAQQIVQLPLLHVGGEPRDEDGADLVGGGVGHGRGRRDDARGRRRRGRGWPLLVVRVDAGAGHGTLALERGGDGRRERAGRVGDVWIWIVVKGGRGCHGRVTSWWRQLSVRDENTQIVWVFILLWPVVNSRNWNIGLESWTFDNKVGTENMFVSVRHDNSS